MRVSVPVQEGSCPSQRLICSCCAGVAKAIDVVESATRKTTGQYRFAVQEFGRTGNVQVLGTDGSTSWEMALMVSWTSLSYAAGWRAQSREQTLEMGKVGLEEEPPNLNQGWCHR